MPVNALAINTVDNALHLVIASVNEPLVGVVRCGAEL